MDRGRRGGSAGLLSNQIGGADLGGGGGRSERDGDPSMWGKGVFRGKHAKVGHARFIFGSLIRIPLSKRGRGRRRQTAENGHERSWRQFETQAQYPSNLDHSILYSKSKIFLRGRKQLDSCR